MAENYPDNSHNNREREKDDSPQSTDRKLGKIVNGTAKARKKSEVKKFASFFIPEDVENVKNYILNDVIIPGIKNAISDVCNILLFGEVNRIDDRRRGSKSRLFYHDRDDRREYSRPRDSGFDYDDILFETRGDADMVLNKLEACINDYGFATVLDLYDLAGITCHNYRANKYGWMDIRTAKAVRVREGYILQLPRAVQID